MYHQNKSKLLLSSGEGWQTCASWEGPHACTHVHKCTIIARRFQLDLILFSSGFLLPPHRVQLKVYVLEAHGAALSTAKREGYQGIAAFLSHNETTSSF